MANIKLEIGKTYPTRGGKLVKIERMHGCHYEGSTPSGGKIHYREDGQLWMGSGSFSEIVGPAIEDGPPIRHREILQAVLEGKTIQITNAAGKPLRDWAERRGEDALLFVLNNAGHHFRVKPAPLVRWCPLGDFGNVFAHSMDRDTAVIRCSELKINKLLRLEFDPDTMDVISSRTEDA